MREAGSTIPRRTRLVFLPPEQIMRRDIEEAISPSG
jgi:hypothetical protein